MPVYPAGKHQLCGVPERYHNNAAVATFPQKQPGLLVTEELDRAIASCKAQVEIIAKDCKAKNRKFRDIEFDLEADKYCCLYGLLSDKTYQDADVRRVTQIFDNPRFFSGDVGTSNDILQGALGDCWFLSALATVSTTPGLVEKIGVARDEQVGVYRFIFFRDNAWVLVIIDDMLYTGVPKWEELNPDEQTLYHYDKDAYTKSARKGGKTLYFANSGTSGETWVPLVEKAYAKLHGNDSHLSGGVEDEGIEDLTGGVSALLQSKDILDIDHFWENELSRANIDRLFGCAFTSLDKSRLESDAKPTVQGLFENHTYSVLRAISCNDKRFVVVRNPWGKIEWTGRWSDGSKEWTAEWQQLLLELGHTFGDEDRIALSGSTNAVIVLSQLDHRYFRDICGRASWTMDFSLAKEDTGELIAHSKHSEFFHYIPISLDDLIKKDVEAFEKKELADAGIVKTTQETVGSDGTVTRTTTTKTTKVESTVVKKGPNTADPKVISQLSAPYNADGPTSKSGASTPAVSALDNPSQPDTQPIAQQFAQFSFPTTGDEYRVNYSKGDCYGDQHSDASTDDEDDGKYKVPQDSKNEVVIVLRVYTNKDVTCSVEGRLRTGYRNPACNTCYPPESLRW